MGKRILVTGLAPHVTTWDALNEARRLIGVSAVIVGASDIWAHRWASFYRVHHAVYTGERAIYRAIDAGKPDLAVSFNTTGTHPCEAFGIPVIRVNEKSVA